MITDRTAPIGVTRVGHAGRRNWKPITGLIGVVASAFLFGLTAAPALAVASTPHCGTITSHGSPLRLAVSGRADCAAAKQTVRTYERRVGKHGAGCHGKHPGRCRKRVKQFTCELSPIANYPLVVRCLGSRRPRAAIRGYGPPEAAGTGGSDHHHFAPNLVGGGFGFVLPFPRGVTFTAGGACGSYFGQGAHHYYPGPWGDDSFAVDFGVCGSSDFGTPVLAAQDGQVVKASFNSAYGNTIVIQGSSCGLATRYAHLNATTVSAGQSVRAGQQIGTLGHTGTGGGSLSNSHLHFAAYSSCRDGARFNPSPIGGYNLCNGCALTSTTDPPGPSDFRAALEAQFPVDSNGSVHVSPGDTVPFGFNLAFNQPYNHDAFVLRPDPDTQDNINRFIQYPNGQPATADFPGASDAPFYRAFVHVAPETCPGNYFVRWNAINAATGQFGNLAPSFYVTVDSAAFTPPPAGAPAYGAQVVGQSSPKLLAPGQAGVVALRIRNTGYKAWDRNVHLATPNDSPIRYGTDGVISDHNRVAFSDESCNGVVSPGEVATFRYTVQDPAGQAAAFRQRFDLIRDGSGPRFADNLGIYIPTVIADAAHFPPELSAADCAWSFVDQSGTPSENGRVVVTNTQDAQWTFTIRNTSELCPWFPTGAVPLRLGTIRPEDRASGFFDSSTWVSTNRVAIPHTVAPGDDVSISFALHPASFVPVGDYNEYMAPVLDGLGHLADIGMYIPVRRN